MRFAAPHALWSLLLLPALIAAYVALLARRKAALRYPNVMLIRQAADAMRASRRHLPPLLFLAALALVLIAMARPSIVVSMPHDQRAIMLAIDVSLSMGDDDVAPTRLAAAQSAARAFISSLPAGVRVGLVAFAGQAELAQAPTYEHAKAIAALDHLQLQYNTAVGAGVVAALVALFPSDRLVASFDIFEADPVLPPARSRGPSATPRSAAIVLLTDGRDTGGLPLRIASKLAAERGVRVYAVGFGQTQARASGFDGEVSDSALDERALKDIAAATGGEYFHAADAHALHDVYRRLDARIAAERRPAEITVAVTALAGLLLLLAGGLSLRWSGPLSCA